MFCWVDIWVDCVMMDNHAYVYVCMKLGMEPNSSCILVLTCRYCCDCDADDVIDDGVDVIVGMMM